MCRNCIDSIQLGRALGKKRQNVGWIVQIKQIRKITGDGDGAARPHKVLFTSTVNLLD